MPRNCPPPPPRLRRVVIHGAMPVALRWLIRSLVEHNPHGPWVDDTGEPDQDGWRVIVQEGPGRTDRAVYRYKVEVLAEDTRHEPEPTAQ